MKAAVVERYGPPEVVKLREMPTPVAGDDEILVRARATTVNSGDARVRGINVPGGPVFGFLMRLALGFNGPKQPIQGFEMAGDVEAVGRNVTRYKVGDRVVGSHGFKFGLHAEYATFTDSDPVALIPEGMSYEDAVALLFGGMTSVIFFRAGGLKAGESILINGASGAVGTMAVQLAKHMGAEVTAVCSAANADLVRSLGADHVIAYDREDFTHNGKTYDVIMDNHGNAPFSRVKGLLKPGGRFLLVIFDKLWTFVSAKWTKQVIEAEDDKTAFTSETFAYLLDLAARGLIRPVIDKTYRFEQIAEAHRHVDTGRKRGSAVVTIA
jgi:NADPH:quinone reductase-like Zn-dependent oxidoreductase